MGFAKWPLNCPFERNATFTLNMSGDIINNLFGNAIKIASKLDEQMKHVARKLVILRNKLIGFFGDHSVRELEYFVGFVVKRPSKKGFLKTIEELNEQLSFMRKPPPSGQNYDWMHWEAVHQSLTNIVAEI